MVIFHSFHSFSTQLIFFLRWLFSYYYNCRLKINLNKTSNPYKFGCYNHFGLKSMFACMYRNLSLMCAFDKIVKMNIKNTVKSSCSSLKLSSLSLQSRCHYQFLGGMRILTFLKIKIIEAFCKTWNFSETTKKTSVGWLNPYSRSGVGKLFLCIGPDSTYFRFYKPYGLFYNYSALLLQC